MAQEHRNRGRICIWRVGFAAITLLLAKGFVRGRCIFLRLIEDRSSLLPGTRIRHAPIAGLFWPWKVICKYWHPSFFNIWAWNCAILCVGSVKQRSVIEMGEILFKAVLYNENWWIVILSIFRGHRKPFFRGVTKVDSLPSMANWSS